MPPEQGLIGQFITRSLRRTVLANLVLCTPDFGTFVLSHTKTVPTGAFKLLAELGLSTIYRYIPCGITSAWGKRTTNIHKFFHFSPFRAFIFKKNSLLYTFLYSRYIRVYPTRRVRESFVITNKARRPELVSGPTDWVVGSCRHPKKL